MKTSDFTYELPKDLIAQDPLEDRSASRLMRLQENGGNPASPFYGYSYLFESGRLPGGK